jgi:hypothetical protein
MHDKALYDRIMARCVETPGPLDTPCMVWTGAKNRHGYGNIWLGGRVFKNTHRVVYESVTGPIDSGMCVMHACDVRGCCNIHHLSLGTHRQNIQDAKNKQRMSCGERSPQSKLTVIQVQEIRRLYLTGNYTHEALGKTYGVGRRQIGYIMSGRNWASLLPPKETP